MQSGLKLLVSLKSLCLSILHSLALKCVLMGGCCFCRGIPEGVWSIIWTCWLLFLRRSTWSKVHAEVLPSPRLPGRLYLEAGAALLMAGRRPADCMALCNEVISTTLELLPEKVLEDQRRQVFSHRSPVERGCQARTHPVYPPKAEGAFTLAGEGISFHSNRPAEEALRPPAQLQASQSVWVQGCGVVKCCGGLAGDRRQQLVGKRPGASPHSTTQQRSCLCLQETDLALCWTPWSCGTEYRNLVLTSQPGEEQQKNALSLTEQDQLSLACELKPIPTTNMYLLGQ
ncbi:Fanconi anemia group G protein isoform X2 [Lates japonicus]|uniref:Fanconi anemia group G protein isoform X2 n=1 Tax=Lates japonicus TaxID=270547 RepID=A0AAD3R3A8_LATJO|nr:Fanconi anemia group G protein isoform X2 [Lates japonicus]